MTVLEDARRRLVADLSAAVTPSLDSLSLGFVAASGHELPITIEALENGQVLLSDGGEPWSDLVTQGFCNPAPTRTQSQRLEKIARLYGVTWDAVARAFMINADLDGIGNAARKLTMAAIALDSWRAWDRELPPAVQQRRRLVRETKKIAEGAGWQAKTGQRLSGRTGRTYRVPLVLEHDDELVAVRIERGTPDNIVDKCIGSFLDTDVPAVVVVPEAVADKVRPSIELRVAKIAVIPRLAKGTAKSIMETAERLARESKKTAG
jgi:hypothetical protein